MNLEHAKNFLKMSEDKILKKILKSIESISKEFQTKRTFLHSNTYNTFLKYMTEDEKRACVDSFSYCEVLIGKR